MKKVLFITSRLIYPVNDGRKVVLYNYCKGLAEQHECEVRLFSLLDKNEETPEQPSFIKKVYKAKTPNKFEKVSNLVYKSFISNKWPLQVSLYYSKKSKQYLNQVIKEYEPDIVIADMARTAEYLNDLDGIKYNKILDMDDVLSKRYRRQAENGDLGSNALGAYMKKLPRAINKILNNGNLMKRILLKEANLLSRYEVSIAEKYRSIVFVSPLEAKEFNLLINSDKSIDITIGVDYEYFSEQVVSDKKKNHIVFLGNMYVAHNKDAVNLFIRDIFPEILKNKPECIFRIVGRCPDDYKEEMSKYNNIEVTGEVNDIRKYIQECTVAIAPLKYGSGIKTKILETIAMGIPVVTNSIGNEGIGLTSRKQAIIEDNAKNMAREIIELLDNEELQKSIINQANDYIVKNHLWNDILERFSKII